MSRSFLSIGDVLTLLRQEFPDVTISKIRFLESQGLVNPERTPSGYRKFYDHDVERLRWVLRQQREHFLPLKVIKGRLEQEVPGEDAGAGNGHERRSQAQGAGPGPRQVEPVLVGGHPGVEAAAEPSSATRPERDARAESETVVSTQSAPTRAARVAPVRGQDAPDHESGPARGDTPRPGARRTSRHPSTGTTPAPLHALSGASMTDDELATAAGLDVASVKELQSYGLLSGRVVGGVEYYDEDALIVARLAAGFAAFGVEARHLRLHKHAAEREAGFVEQVVLPLLKQRNPESRQRAHSAATELSRLGQQLREVLLRTTLREQLGG